MIWLEAACNGMATLSILLAARNSIHTWWTGIIGCTLFAWLFFSTQLYADALLQVFFVAASAVGWWQWAGSAGQAPLKVGSLPLRDLAGFIAAAAVIALAYGALLHHFTNAYAPFADSAVLSLSVLAQLLLMRRKVETWPIWLLVNIIAVPLYASRGLTITAVLYAVYWVNACVAWMHWRRLRRQQAMAA